MPRISCAKIEPMCANWSRCSGRASAFAPQSRSTDGPFFARDRHGDRRAQDARDAADLEQAGREHRAGVAGRHDCVCPALRDRAAGRRRASCPALRARPRPASRPSRSLARRRRARARGRPGRQARRGPGTIPSAAASSAPGDDLAGPAVAAHRVDGNRDGHVGLEAGAERLDVAALVRLAVRADAMRPLRLPAGRADVHARRLDAVLGAALVAAGLGGFLLRDGHASRGSIARAAYSSSLQPFERGPARVGLLLLVVVRLGVQVLPADRAEAGAVGPAEDLVRQREDRARPAPRPRGRAGRRRGTAWSARRTRGSSPGTRAGRAPPRRRRRRGSACRGRAGARRSGARTPSRSRRA